MKMEEFNNTNKSRVQTILDLLEKYPTYCDENDRQHIFIDNIDYLVNSKAFNDELYTICACDNGMIISPTLIKNVIQVLRSKIRKNGEKVELDYRNVLDSNGNFSYQLNKQEMIVTNDTGSKEQPIIVPTFKMSNTFIKQAKPSNTPNIDRMLDLFNLDEDDKFLMEVLSIQFFVPKIPKLSIVFTGATGTGKSTMTTYIKCLIDPAPVETTKAPKSVGELEKRLANNYLPCFDNVDNLTKDQSNALCRAITGDTYEKITNDTSYIASYIRPIIINGIKCPIYKEDIIDRFIIFEPPKIDVNYKERMELDKIFYEELPNALAYIFSILPKAIARKKDLKLDKVYRMADSYCWCYAIADVIEPNGGKRFERLFKEKLNKQNEMIINNNYVALAMKDYVYNSGMYFIHTREMTMTDLYESLLYTANEYGYNKVFTRYCKDVSQLGKEIRQVQKILEREGIIIDFEKRLDANYISIIRKPKE